MASIRRTLSGRICELRASSSYYSSLSGKIAVSSTLSQAFSLFSLTLLSRLVAMVDGGPKASVWRKLLLQFGVCFSLGLCLGFFTPHNKWPAAYVPDSLVEGKNFIEGDLLKAAAETNMDSPQARATVNVDAGIGSRFPGLSATLSMPLEPRKLLIVVTPTHNRPFQHYYLTRLAHVLKLVPPPLLWLVIEEHTQSLETATLLRETGVMYRHLVCEKALKKVKDRGTYQRNVALAHIEQHQLDGIVYFADDDNMYSLELFEQMRQIKRFGTWLVGLLEHGKSRTVLEGPVCEGEKVIGWHTNEKSKRLRRFHVDMSGFAFNSTILWDPRRWRRPTLEPIRQLDTIKEGFQETTFIEQLVADESHMEARPPGCLKVMVWHLHLEAPRGSSYPPGWTLTAPLQANLPLRQDTYFLKADQYGLLHHLKC